MLTNRSMPQAMVIPELAYEDVGAAVQWLCKAFGFEERLRIADHRAQLVLGTGAMVVTQRRSNANAGGDATHAVMVRVEDANAHYAHVAQCGARVLQPPTDYPYGERQYTVQDPGGHVWTFSQTLADIDPAGWGGTLRQNSSGTRPQAS